MSIAIIIRTHHQAIVSEWETFAAEQLPAAALMRSHELRDSIEVMLAAIAEDLENEQATHDKAEKSHGRRPGHAPVLTQRSREHANNRLQHAFTVNQVVAEFRALRASVLRLYATGSEPVDAAALEDMTRFNEAIDQALTESVAWYSARVGQARDMFIGVLGHDLRNPLGAVKMSASFLLQNDRLDADCARAAIRIVNSAWRMQQMVADLLDFTRARLGTGLPLTNAHIDLSVICQEVVDELRAFHPERIIAYDDNGPVRGEWDAGRLAQLVSNLVGNALQHGQAGKPVTVSLAHGQANEVVLSVHNHGAPIPYPAMANIFDPMAVSEDLPGAAGKERTGLGLGLFICKAIAVAHGGLLDVQSTEEQGTTFRVTLPQMADSLV